LPYDDVREGIDARCLALGKAHATDPIVNELLQVFGRSRLRDNQA